MKTMIFFVALLTCNSSLSAETVGKSTTSTSHQIASERKIGVGVGLGKPYPGLIGLNAGYHLTPNLRLTAGYAEVEVTTSMTYSEGALNSSSTKAQTYALGSEYFFTDWRVRPGLGLHAGYFSVKGDGAFSINGFDRSTAHIYSSVGFDWIARSGFNLGTGLNVALVEGSGTSFFLNAGYFF